MWLIDDTYFTGDYIIPNKVQIDVGGGSSDSLDYWIDKYARQPLKYALGDTLYADFITNIDGSGNYVAGVTKWDNLVNGVSYTYAGNTYKWEGLLQAEGSYKQSLLTPYVYTNYLRDKTSRLSGVGEVKQSAVNGRNVNSTQRFVRSWNDFVNRYQHAHEQLPLLSYVNGVPFTDWSGSENTFVSMITFLVHNESDYEDADLGLYDYQNSLGL
jgi:hypothetical protein